MPLTTLQDVAGRIDDVVRPLADYKRGDDRSLRIYAEDTLKALLADVRETLALDAATAPEEAPEGTGAAEQPERESAADDPPATEGAAPLRRHMGGASAR